MDTSPPTLPQGQPVEGIGGQPVSSPPPPSQARQAGLVLLVLSGCGVMLCLVGTGLLVLFVGLAEGAGEADSWFIAVGLLALGLGLALPLTWQGGAALLRRPSAPFTPRRAWPLALLFFVALAGGQLVLILKLMPGVVMPFFHLIATVVPPLLVVALVARHLHRRAGLRFSRREVIFHLAAGALGATFPALILEGIGALFLVLFLAVGILVLPGGEAYLEALRQQLEMVGQLPDADRAMALLRRPEAILFLLLLFAVITPLVEEFLKPWAAVLLSGRRRPPPGRVFFWGVVAGAGFAIAEGFFNVALSVGVWTATALLRAVTATLHSLGTGVVALGWGRFWTERRAGPLLGGYLLALVLHALWNGAIVGLQVVGAFLAWSEGGQGAEAPTPYLPALILLAVLAMSLLGMLLVAVPGLLAAVTRRVAVQEASREAGSLTDG